MNKKIGLVRVFPTRWVFYEPICTSLPSGLLWEAVFGLEFKFYFFLEKKKRKDSALRFVAYRWQILPDSTRSYHHNASYYTSCVQCFISQNSITHVTLFTQSCPVQVHVKKKNTQKFIRKILFFGFSLVDRDYRSAVKYCMSSMHTIHSVPNRLCTMTIQAGKHRNNHHGCSRIRICHSRGPGFL